jgi:hypothetical protein
VTKTKRSTPATKRVHPKRATGHRTSVVVESAAPHAPPRETKRKVSPAVTAAHSAEQRRIRLMVEAERAIEALRNENAGDETEKAYQVAWYALRVLAHVPIALDAGEPVYADAGKLRRVWRVLRGGVALGNGATAVAEGDAEDAIRFREVAGIIDFAANSAKVHARSLALHMLRSALGQVDAAFLSATDSVLLSALDARTAGNAMSGVLADLLIATGALGIPPRRVPKTVPATNDRGASSPAPTRTERSVKEAADRADERTRVAAHRTTLQKRIDRALSRP